MSRKVNQSKPAVSHSRSRKSRRRPKRSGSFVPGAIFLEIIAALALYSLFNYSAEVRQSSERPQVEAPANSFQQDVWNNSNSVVQHESMQPVFRVHLPQNHNSFGALKGSM